MDELSKWSSNALETAKTGSTGLAQEVTANANKNAVRSLTTGNALKINSVNGFGGSNNSKDGEKPPAGVDVNIGAVSGVGALSGLSVNVGVDQSELKKIGAAYVGDVRDDVSSRIEGLKSDFADTFDGWGSEQNVDAPDVSVQSSTYYADDDDIDDKPAARADGFYRANVVTEDADNEDELLDKIRMQTVGLNIDNGVEDGLYQDSANFLHYASVLDEEFNFRKLLKNQYLVFSDYDITDILDFLFTLHSKYSHKVTYPAAVIYQCVRYADHVKNNATLVENFLNLTFTKIRSNVTTSMSGVTNVLKDGDIVLQSYWVSVVNFLYYYLCKDEGFFSRYPSVLQELITTLNSLIMELTNCLKFRMHLILDDCLLNYTNIPDLSDTLYKNDWNFFKKKHVKHSSFDDIYQMLYPPSVQQQLKPSPIKIVQIMGALVYVLDIHKVHPLIKQQCFAIVFQWLSFTVFNKVISSKKHLSRKKAIQTRLNLSVLEDWARTNNLTPKMPEMDNDIYKRFPYTLTEGEAIVSDEGFTPRSAIHSCMFYRGDESNPGDLAFYHTSLFHILRYFFEPLYELLEWLQCVTSLKNGEELTGLLQNLAKLNHFQLIQTVNKYRYEVEEAKFPKELKTQLQGLSKTKDQNVKRLPYLDKNLVCLNGNYPYPVGLPTVSELVDEYGAGLGGIKREQASEYLPVLPIDIMDAIDEIHEQRTAAYENREEDQEPEENDEDDDEDEQRENDDRDNQRLDVNKDDGIFKELQVPSSLLHKTWGTDENEVNPW